MIQNSISEGHLSGLSLITFYSTVRAKTGKTNALINDELNIIQGCSRMRPGMSWDY